MTGRIDPHDGSALARRLLIACLVLGVLSGDVSADRLAIFEAIERCPGEACIQCAGKDLVTCGAGTDCRTRTVEWARNADFVAIRDLEMCEAPEPTGLIHGLAIPIKRVEGSEAPHPPPGIWAFAWDVAKLAIGAENEDQIALLVNPCGPRRADGTCSTRSQDQLHVHILRFCEGRKDEALAGAKPIAHLDEAWARASAEIIPGGLESGTDGVLVAKRGGAYLVAVHKGNVAKRFTSSTYDRKTKTLNCLPGP
jgi:hypothetical protein